MAPRIIHGISLEFLVVPVVDHQHLLPLLKHLWLSVLILVDRFASQLPLLELSE